MCDKINHKPNKMRKIYFLTVVMLLMNMSIVVAQRHMENLDRGLVAVKVNTGVFVSWRTQGYEWYDVTYNLYRDGSKINSEPLEVSNYQDDAGTINSEYSVAAIIKGVVQEPCPVVKPLSNQYLEIPMVTRPAGYEVNDATAADLDGDGEYEIIVKRIIHDWTVEATQFAFFEAYKMDGTLMWEINVGPNIMSSSAVEINIAAFDFDEDGKAEVFMRTSEGTIFGDGTEIGDTDGDNITNYRYSVVQSGNMEYMQEGPEFLSLINGETGAELDRVDFIPRISSAWWWGGNTKAYGHRANKFFFGAPYLDGIHPSLFIGRGIYTQTVMRTYDVVDKKLVMRWQFHTDQNPSYFGQGNHNYTIADVDMDGRDEIVWGSMTVDDDGTGLYSTGLGHGDALHVGDLDPFRKGTEIWKCLENSPVYGTVLYDGATGEILIHDVLGRDCGRCMAANISDEVKGATLWGSTTMFSASTKEPVSVQGNSVNFRIYWDGDLLEELLDKDGYADVNGVIQKSGSGNIFTAYGTKSCNWTKGTPTLQADLFGDWREEVIWRNSDDSKIRIYTTVDPTIYRNYSLMHDPQYRQAICWQMCGYNQPPHVSYFLGKGEGIVVPPPPTITNGRLVYNGSGSWDKTSSDWIKDGTITQYSDGEHVLFDVLNGNDVTVSLAETVSPSVMTVNSPGNYTLDVNGGMLSGNMKMIKQGLGDFTFSGDHDYSGITEVWNGRLKFSGSLQNSRVWLNLFGELETDGALNKGLSMRYGSVLSVGGDDVTGSLTIGDSLNLEDNSIIVLDLYTPSSDQNDVISVNGDLIVDGNPVFQIITHLQDGVGLIEPGNYILFSVTDSIDSGIVNASVEGIQGASYDIEVIDNNVVLVVKGMREGASVVWSGVISNRWDLATTANFLNGETDDVFVTGDTVTINDSSTRTRIQIMEDINPGQLIVNTESSYFFSGNGAISGGTSLTKEGSGNLVISNNNTFTGKVTINSGTLSVREMPSSLSETSSIGPVSTNPNLLEINGGTLSILIACDADRAAHIGSNGGTIDNDVEVKWNNLISGGELTKTGTGNLIFASGNSNSKTIIQEGSISLYDYDSRPGSLVVFEGGTLYCYNSTGGNADNISTNYYVEEGQTGKLYLDGRANYGGTLKGAGTINMYVPFVRTYLVGNYSEFTGTINLMYNKTGAYEPSIDINNTYGYENAKVFVDDGLALLDDRSQTVKIGTLTGTGYIGGASTWELGARNEDFTLQVNIGSGNIRKVGTGAMTIPSGKSYTGTTTIDGGAIYVTNSSGSATGTGSVIVKSNGLLGGTGNISGAVTVQSNGTISAGQSSLVGTLKLAGNLSIQGGGILLAEVNADNNTSDLLSVAGTTTLGGITINITKLSGTYSVGDQFKLIECGTINGTISEIIPEVPGAGLEWDLTEFATSGIISVIDPTGISDHNVETLKMYPNPSDGNVSINLPEGNDKSIIRIESVNGSILMEKAHCGRSMQLDLSGFSDGLYIVKVISDDKIFIGKVIKE